MATADNFNRRKLERSGIESPIMVRFGTHSMTGKLIDIGLGGLLSIFKRDNAQPVIFDTVSFNIELDQDMAFADMEGFIIRIQAAEARLDSEYIKYAIKFMNVNGETESRLSKYLKKIFPHQW